MQRMVVLANSKKHGGYCLAGRALDAQGYVGDWMRPVVSEDAADGLSYQRTLCKDGRPVQILDVVSANWGKSAPVLHQQENRLMGQALFQRCGRIAWAELDALADDAKPGLWFEGFSSSCGCNDRIPALLLPEVASSLRLIRVKNLILQDVAGFGGGVKHRACFRFGLYHYNLSLTDTVAIGWMAGQSRLGFAEAYLCVSLAVPFRDGFSYKLAAAVITPERAGETA